MRLIANCCRNILLILRPSRDRNHTVFSLNRFKSEESRTILLQLDKYILQFNKLKSLHVLCHLHILAAELEDNNNYILSAIEDTVYEHAQPYFCDSRTLLCQSHKAQNIVKLLKITNLKLGWLFNDKKNTFHCYKRTSLSLQNYNKIYVCFIALRHYCATEYVPSPMCSRPTPLKSLQKTSTAFRISRSRCVRTFSLPWPRFSLCWRHII